MYEQSWNQYQRRLMLLRASNPALFARERSRPVTFNVNAAPMPYMNNGNFHASTCIRRITYNPLSNNANISFGGSYYPYVMTPFRMRMFMTSNSLGRFYNQNMRR